MNHLRVSVATYNKVLFPNPENGMAMLALERKATALKDGSVNVRAQPFGGGVKILNPKSLKEVIGEIQFDSDRSKQEQDFRILIQPSQWDAVKQYCLKHLEDPTGLELESAPDRELAEEFEEGMGVILKSSQYTVQATGIVIENIPVWTENWYAGGFPTVRVYRTYKVEIVDGILCQNLVDTSWQVSDEMLGKHALENGMGRANSVLALPLHRVREAFLALPLEKRFTKIDTDHHKLEKSVLVVLEDIEVSQYLRL
jgi:hypothetical protein